MYRYIIGLTILFLLMSVGAEADEYRIVKITQTDTLCLKDNGDWVDCSDVPYVLGPSTVWGNRQPGPGVCFVMGTVYISNNYEHGWELCFSGGDWEPIDEPLLLVTVDAALSLSDFISSDTWHKVRAEIENIQVVEEWQGYANEGHATSGILSFNPKTAKEPTITFHPESVDETVGHPKELSYIVKAKVSDIVEQTTITQNNLNQLRQEYVDVSMDRVPGINSFDQESANFAKLLDKPTDLHSHHEHWIVKAINSKAQALKNEYGGTWFFTSGFRCPVRNIARNFSRNSKHTYGRAFDFDAGSDDVPANSEKNYRIYDAGSNISVNRRWLYDEDGVQIDEVIPEWPEMPDGVEKYTKGHMDWN